MNDKPSFFDGKTLGAIAVVFVVWMGWQYYMKQKYPHLFDGSQQQEEVKKSVSQAGEDTKSESDQQKVAAPLLKKEASLEASKSSIETTKESILIFESPYLSFDLSSTGMSLRNIRLNHFTDRSGQVIRIGSPDPDQSTLGTYLIGQSKPLSFELSKIDDRTFLGRAQWEGLEIIKKMEVSASHYEVKTTIDVKGAHPNFIGVSTSLVEKVVPVKGGSFFTPQYERQEFYIEGADSSDRVHVTDEDESKSYAKLNLVSVGSQYFTQAFINHSEILPELKVNVVQNPKLATAQISYPVLTGSDYLVSYSSFLGPKDVDLLKKVDSELDNVIDFGFFSWIAKYILIFLKSIYAFVGNWGVAIILLTAAVRVLVLPFNIMSYKSMKVMQTLQPQMKAVREKYKDDQQRMNQEIMALMKSHKANPLGGCLPMLLQFPIFIALYQVLGHSIELYQAPFAFWIHDLSAKDPYYVLPVLMGVTLFVQQKITPNTMDPAQAKVMMFLPLLFSFFMLSLPSGLTLYIFVSGVFGVLQQLYFMKFNQVEEPVTNGNRSGK